MLLAITLWAYVVPLATVVSVNVVTFGPTAPTFVHAPPLADLWTVKPVSLSELSAQVNATLCLLPLPSRVAIGAPGVLGGTARTMARIISFSSWPRIWQCQ